MRRVESDRLQSTKLTEAVARYYFKLLAYKDEYEVARLHADPAFRARIASQFEGDYRLNFHLAPPLLARPDPNTGRISKMQFGPWMMPVFSLLAKPEVPARDCARHLRLHRGAPHRARADRRIRGAGRRSADAARRRQPRRRDVSSRSLPEEIRGYGHIRAAGLARAPKTAGRYCFRDCVARPLLR